MVDPSPNEPLWKQTLRAELETILIAVPSGLPADSDDFPLDTSDLYHFYKELVVFRNEFRQGNRRMVDTFTQMGSTLSELNATVDKVREDFSTPGESERSEPSLSRSQALSLIELDDRLRRLGRVLQSPPSPATKFWQRTPPEWPEAWEGIRQAVDIALDHSARLLSSVGVTPIPTKDRDFDPTLMNAVARDTNKDQPKNRVVEEVTRGYLDATGKPLRLAEVRVNVIK